MINTSEGREKPRNLEQDPRASISMLDPDDPSQHMLVQAKLAAIEREGADEHLDRLAKKYLGKDNYPHREDGEVRVILRFDIEQISLND